VVRPTRAVERTETANSAVPLAHCHQRWPQENGRLSENIPAHLESLRHEHAELCNYHRHYSGLRFVVFTVYFAVLGGIAAVAFGLADIRERDFPLVIWARAAGLVVTVAFFLFEVLCERNARYYAESIRKLARDLGYLQMAQKPRAWLKAKYVTFPLYLLLLAFWVFALVALRASCN
jgi:ABC-type branched-subunit amino acid transport system permease subunit